MSDRYIPAFITLLAGAITSIINIVNKVDVYTSLKRLLIVLIIFYIVGLITRSVIIKISVKKDEKDKDNDTDEEETDEVGTDEIDGKEKKDEDYDKEDSDDDEDDDEDEDL